jgi:hypothetical protein
MKIPRHKLENNTINSVFHSGSNTIITKKICPKGPKLCSAKCMASLHCLLYCEIWYHTCIKIRVELNVIVLGKWVDLPQPTSRPRTKCVSSRSICGKSSKWEPYNNGSSSCWYFERTPYLSIATTKLLARIIFRAVLKFPHPAASATRILLILHCTDFNTCI